VCLHRQCQCEGCQQHDQLLAILSKERVIRRGRREKRRGEDLLSQDTAKKVKEEMEIIEDGIQFINQAARSGEVIVLSSDSDEEDCKDTFKREASDDYEKDDIFSGKSFQISLDRRRAPLKKRSFFSSHRIFSLIEVKKEEVVSVDEESSDELPDPEDYFSNKSSPPISTSVVSSSTSSPTNTPAGSPLTRSPSTPSSSGLVISSPDVINLTSSHADYVGGGCNQSSEDGRSLSDQLNNHQANKAVKSDNGSSDENANDSSEVTKIKNEQDISELASVNDGNNNESIVCAGEVKSMDLVMPSEPSSVPCMKLICELVAESIKTES